MADKESFRMQKMPITARRLSNILNHAGEKHVWVIGDVFLDDYIEGNIERISPEAPVQVVHVTNEFQRLGGAANVANGLVSLGARVTLSGIIGPDASGRIFLDLCARQKISADGVMEVRDRSTIRKLRVMSKHQQMIRLDWESIVPINEKTESEILDYFYRAQPPDAVVLSDYGKGVLTVTLIRGLMDLSRKYGVPVIADPKSHQCERYSGAAVVTPNFKEFRAMAGALVDPEDDAAMAAAARDICETAHVHSLLVTMGDIGMAIWTRDEGLCRIPAAARDVYDVTGAGDTVVATLALSLANGADLLTATVISNAAAGIVVGKSGTATVQPDELVEALSPRTEDKLLDRHSLDERLFWWQLQKKRIVFTNGCFDMLHVGHLHLLHQAAALGDVLIVGLNTDSSIRRLNKGPERPLIPEKERAALVSALDCVNAVVLFEQDTPLELIKKIQPDILVKGADYRMDQVVGKSEIEALGGKVVLVDLLPDRSTSRLIDRIRNGGSFEC
jgi:D-beta-D-heptose 7-phosphate kinase / D-beta-D-heptose 1-phosphate adenosyltransferase